MGLKRVLIYDLQIFSFSAYNQHMIKRLPRKLLIINCLLLIVSIIYSLLTITNSVQAQGFNIASTYLIADDKAVSGDIIISAGEKGLTRTDISYDNRVFGVMQDNPLVVLRPASGSAQPNSKPIIRIGDTIVNVNNFNGDIKKGDYITASPQLGKGMKAGQSGYVVGLALEDADLSGEPTTILNKQVKTGTVRASISINYAELTSARNNIALLNSLNAAFFRNIQDPEKFTSVIRFVAAGVVAVLAFTIGFFSISRSLAKSTEAIGRNPLAKRTIMLTVAAQIVLTAMGGIAAIAIVFIIIRF